MYVDETDKSKQRKHNNAVFWLCSNYLKDSKITSEKKCI